MDKPRIRGGRGPEEIIQTALIKFLEDRGWFVKSTHGNVFQFGFPDLYATHKLYGPRWIEVKNPLAFAFTPAQLVDFPKFTENGTKIWILVAATNEEYQKLFKEPNWYYYFLKSKGVV